MPRCLLIFLRQLCMQIISDGVPVVSDFEVNFDWIDKRHQPVNEVLVDGMRAIGVESGLVSELHDSTQPVARRAGGEIHTCQGLDEAWNLSLKCANLCERTILLIFGGLGSPAKCKGVNDHGFSVPKLYGHWLRQDLRRWSGGSGG